MKLNLLATTVVLLVAFLQRYECRAIESPSASQRVAAAETDPVQDQTLPVMERVGEEYYIRLANGKSNSFRSTPKTYLGESPASYNKALKLQLTRRLLEGKVGNVRALIGSIVTPTEESMERGRRSEEPPISLDLTFHLLREMMEMSKAEQMAQQAQNNRRMMELFGK